MKRTVVNSGLALVIGLALVKLLIHLVLVGRYGYFRDELYYLACADHLAWGFVDHPPLSIFILASLRSVLGDSLVAIRLFPALLGALLVLFTGLIAREFGGGRCAQFLASLMAFFAPINLALSTLYSMNIIELCLWAIAFWLLLLIVKRNNPRLWLVFGLVAGLSLLNKLSGAVFGLALVLALLLTEQRRQFRLGWFYLGGAIAVLLFLPHLLWQIKYDWPFLEFIANAKAYKMVLLSLIPFVGGQVLLLGPLAAPIWLTGVFYLLFAEQMRSFRVLGILLVIAYAIFIAGQGKSYYFAPLYPLGFAAGALALERLRAVPRWRWLGPIAIVLVSVSGLLLFPLSVPLLSPESLIRYAKTIGISAPQDERHEAGQLPPHFADRFGWPEMAATVALVYRSLSDEDKADCAIFADNYGEAAAVDFFGKELGLPPAISSHNSYWLWGPGNASGKCVIAIGVSREEIEGMFASVKKAARFSAPFIIPYEKDLPVFVCRDLKVPLDRLWPKLKKFI